MFVDVWDIRFNYKITENWKWFQIFDIVFNNFLSFFFRYFLFEKEKTIIIDWTLFIDKKSIMVILFITYCSVKIDR